MEIAIIIAIMYFIPSFIAFNKSHGAGVFVLNLFLGWTFIGWVVALAWAVLPGNISNIPIETQRPRPLPRNPLTPPPIPSNNGQKA